MTSRPRRPPTGGGPGTNQYGIKGAASARPSGPQLSRFRTTNRPAPMPPEQLHTELDEHLRATATRERIDGTPRAKAAAAKLDELVAILNDPDGGVDALAHHLQEADAHPEPFGKTWPRNDPARGRHDAIAAGLNLYMQRHHDLRIPPDDAPDGTAGKTLAAHPTT